MAGPIDFSDLGAVEAKGKPIDFSDLGATEVNEDYSKDINAAIRGYAQGGMMGHADEAGAKLQTLLASSKGSTGQDASLLKKFNLSEDASQIDVDAMLAKMGMHGDITPTKEAFEEKALNEERAADVEAQKSDYYIPANIAGSIAPAMGIGAAAKGIGLGAKGLSLAKGAEGPLNIAGNATKYQKLLDMAVQGGVGGAITGYGMNEKPEDLASDIAMNAGVGAAAGPILSTAIGGGMGAAKKVGKMFSGVADFAGDTQIGKGASRAFDFESKGEKILGGAAHEDARKSLLQKAASVLEGNDEVSEKIVAELNAARQEALETGTVGEKGKALIERIKSKIIELQGRGQTNAAAKHDAELLQSYMDDLLQGTEQTVGGEFQKWTPASNQFIKGNPGTRVALEEEMKRLKIQHPKKMFNIVETPDPSGGNHKYLHIEETLPAMENRNITESAGRAFEMSPEGKSAAQSAIASLQAQNKINGVNTAYELVEDGFNGKYVIKAIEDGWEATKGSSKNFKPQLEVPPVPDQNITIPSIRGQDIETMPVPFRKGGLIDDLDKVSTMSKVQETFNDLGSDFQKNRVTPFKSSDAEAFSRSIAGDAGKIIDESSTRLAAAKNRSKAMFQAAEQLGVSDPNEIFQTNAATGLTELKPGAMKRILDFTRQAGNDEAVASVSAEERMMKAKELVEHALGHPVPTFDKAIRAAERFDITRRAGDVGFSKVGMVRQGAIIGGALAGKGYKVLADIMGNQPQLQKTVEGLRSMGTAVGNHIADRLEGAGQKDIAGRNAILFSLEQNPEMRKYLEEIFGKPEE